MVSEKHGIRVKDKYVSQLLRYDLSLRFKIMTKTNVIKCNVYLPEFKPSNIIFIGGGSAT